jgi:DNA-binding NarL/FixJ family response regulator
MADKISVLIADDFILNLEGLSHILKGIGDIEVVALASTTLEVLELATKLQPDVIVLDMAWPDDKRAGIKMIRELRVRSSKSMLIAMTAYPELLREAANAGASNTLDKGFSRQEIIDAIREAGSHINPPTNTITVLFLAADPTDTSRLRLSEELREIQEKLQLAKLRERFGLHQRMSVRPTDISQALLDVQPGIVHFSGHGTATGALCFENELGKVHPVEPDALAALFEQFASQVNPSVSQ